MQFTSIIVLALGAIASALPQGDSQQGSSPVPASGEPAGSAKHNQANVCGNGSKVSCCNTSNKNALIPVLGSLCTLQVPIIGATLGNTCGAEQQFCCTVDQDGLINVGDLCIPIST